MELLKKILYGNLELIPFSILKNIQNQRLLLPLYHIVSDEKVPHVVHSYSYKNVRQFEHDLDFLLKHFNPISLSDLMQNINNKEKLSHKSFLLTFDDGYREVADIIAPILLKKSIPAVFFICSAFVDNKSMLYRNKASLLIDRIKEKNNQIPIKKLKLLLEENDIVCDDLINAFNSISYHQKKLLDDAANIMNVDFNAYLKEKSPFLTSTQITKLINQGFDIGSHSIDHPLYKYLSLEEQLRQTWESFNFLQQRFPLPYRAFAFPNNDKGVKSFVKETHFNKEIEISFGTSSFGKGYCINNFQRQSMENTNDSAGKIYKELFKYEIFKQLKNNHAISAILSGRSKKTNSVDSDKKADNRNDEKIRLEKIKVKDLVDFIKKYNSNKTDRDVAVISEQRAIAHSHNPIADENDIGLVLAYKSNSCVGYLGLLPGLVEIRGNIKKIYFPSSWLVSDQVRGQSLGSLLMKEALTLDKALICTGMNNSSEGALKYLGFESMKSLFYWQLNFEKCSQWLLRSIDKSVLKFNPSRNQLNKTSKPFFYEKCKADSYKKISKTCETYLANIYYEEVKSIKFESQNSGETKNYRFIRNIEVINWMLQYAWIKNRGSLAKEQKTGYFFSEVRDLFKYIALEIYSKETRKKLGYVVFSISKENNKTTMKLLDHEIEATTKNQILIGLVLKYASSIKADKLDITSEVARQLTSENVVSSVLLKKIERRYLYYMSDMSGRLALAIKNVNPNYCDGDMPFY
jgi:peptidoglycan/xylan/chitin deacetylase (PgdA/CDA1 family)